MDGHVFLEYMSYESICFKGCHALQEEMSCGGHEDTSWMRNGFTGEYVLLEVMYYMMVCFTDGHVLQECMWFEWTCIIEIHELK